MTDRDIPRVMSTQHPDNATLPFFATGDVIKGDDEIQEAYYVYSHLGCDEQMWDFEGKEGDEYAVKKLLSRYDDFFVDHPLGSEARLTIRGPNPDVERSEAKILLEILESIPRSFDAAALFYGNQNLPIRPPIFEVIIPMVTGAEQLNLVHKYYQQFVTGKGDKTVWGDRTVAQWVGEFKPDDIGVIPLIEDREHLLDAAGIVRGYVTAQGVESQRVFLARSDPALNYGSLSADLINRVALQRLYRMGKETGVDIYPILGAGPSPFRGGLTPETASETVGAYPWVETFTVQSGFKYDYPVETVREGVETLRETERDARPPRVDADRALEIVDRVAEAYGRQVAAVAPLVNRIAEYVPARRARKLHVGLFGYSREVSDTQLPRAIGFTAALYSIGFPPMLMGLSGLSGGDTDFVAETFPRFFDLLRTAARYYNPRSLELVEIPRSEAEAGLELVDVEPDTEHRAATDDAIEAIERGDADAARTAVKDAARTRRFLG